MGGKSFQRLRCIAAGAHPSPNLFRVNQSDLIARELARQTFVIGPQIKSFQRPTVGPPGIWYGSVPFQMLCSLYMKMWEPLIVPARPSYEGNGHRRACHKERIDDFIA
jgi:hypothetical protein